jgi:hypothetical protein
MLSNYPIREAHMTTIYRAEFFTAADYAVRDFEAETPDQALELARRFYNEDLGELEFRSYDHIEPLDAIDIWHTEQCAGARQISGRALLWDSDEFRLRQAAPQLRAALALIRPHYAEFLGGVGADLGQCNAYQAAKAALAVTEPKDINPGSVETKQGGNNAEI